jgi:hypothetical protein
MKKINQQSTNENLTAADAARLDPIFEDAKATRQEVYARLQQNPDNVADHEVRSADRRFELASRAYGAVAISRDIGVSLGENPNVRATGEATAVQFQGTPHLETPAQLLENPPEVQVSAAEDHTPQAA